MARKHDFWTENMTSGRSTVDGAVLFLLLLAGYGVSGCLEERRLLQASNDLASDRTVETISDLRSFPDRNENADTGIAGTQDQADPKTFCGDSLCEPSESCDTCPDDCGICCIPECAGIECGDDGCGGSCGVCAGPGFGCVAGRCRCVTSPEITSSKICDSPPVINEYDHVKWDHLPGVGVGMVATRWVESESCGNCNNDPENPGWMCWDYGWNDIAMVKTDLDCHEIGLPVEFSKTKCDWLTDVAYLPGGNIALAGTFEASAVWDDLCTGFYWPMTAGAIVAMDTGCQVEVADSDEYVELFPLSDGSMLLFTGYKLQNLYGCTQIWSLEYGDPGFGWFSHFVELTNGDVVAFEDIGSSWRMVRLNSDGDTTVQVPGTLALVGPTEAGGIALSAHGPQGGTPGAEDPGWVAVLDGAGTMLWDAVYQSAERHRPVGLHDAGDGGLLTLWMVSDAAQEDGPDYLVNWSLRMVRFDELGNVTWQQVFSDGQSLTKVSLEAFGEGWRIITGVGDAGLWILELGPECGQ
ncbi:MAG: hypothetical protein ABIK09_15085 [Pseudomonadota bacterium]